MKIPAAIARIARITPSPPIGTNADKPQRMRKIASNNIPIFLVIFMVIILSFVIFLLHYNTILFDGSYISPS